MKVGKGCWTVPPILEIIIIPYECLDQLFVALSPLILTESDLMLIFSLIVDKIFINTLT